MRIMLQRDRGINSAIEPSSDMLDSLLLLFEWPLIDFFKCVKDQFTHHSSFPKGSS